MSHRGPGGVRARLLFAFLLSGLAASPASAQVSVDLWPSIGGYFPLSDFDREFAQLPGSSAGGGSQGPGLVLGFGGTVWVNSRIGVALHLATAASDVTFSTGDKQDGRIGFYGAELLVRVSGTSPKHGAYLAIGPTIIDRSGKAFEGLTHSSSVAGTLSFGSYYRLADGIRLRGDLSGLLYRLRLEGGTDYTYPRSNQFDVLMRLGVALDPLGMSHGNR